MRCIEFLDASFVLRESRTRLLLLELCFSAVYTTWSCSMGVGGLGVRQCVDGANVACLCFIIL